MKNTIVVRKLSKGWSLLLLPVVIWLFVNATVNRHTHFFSDGYYLSHAHPYDKTSSGEGNHESHRHSEAEIILLAFISDPVAPVLILLSISLILYAIPRLSGILQNHTEPVKEYYQVHHYHAPPEL